MLGFWEKLHTPIMALAPLANVTDAAFRRIIAKYGKPDVCFTEFVSADGLLSEGREKLLVDLLYSESERPIVAQLFSGNPEKMFEAAKLVKRLGFDGLDINMGCPDRAIEKSGAGAALIKNPKLARELIRAAKTGLMYSTSEMYCTSKIPVSIKTRLGYSKDTLEEWLPELLAERPAAITIHARTRKEMSKVPAHWDRVKRAVEIRDAFFSSLPILPNKGGAAVFGGGGCLGAKTLILGNGDVMSIAEAYEKAEETGADGCLLGRAIFGNPWLFAGLHSPLEKGASPTPPARGVVSSLRDGVVGAAGGMSIEQRLRVMVEHARLFEKLLGEHKNFAIMKKHFKAYAEGFDGAKELRMKLMETENAAEVEKVLSLWKSDIRRQLRTNLCTSVSPWYSTAKRG